ncbi:nitrite reductase large subunit NirB [Acidihalobacter prosperus]|uniref:Nitrite reductase [NAD(P)H] large subunit n=1 Tax=Acidihalobacter prosperus TaxID=160660 RepID=A0A1A6C2V4_9GAMM|nr:nitrite reductase large subunit NirB [Acidihalobacter prosperus]OBS08875.1 Nitrite reductase [NAD(P)H] large subunit [Acidihalobacter prosperus]
MTGRQKLVLVGNGMAGVRTLEELLKLAPDMYDITVFGDEPYGNYNRIMLSPVLAGEKTVDDIILNDDAWYADNGITLHKGKRVTRIDRVRRCAITDDGTEAPYDRLILATGSKPFIIPVPGHDKQGVIAFRDIHDVDTMLASSRTGRRAVVIGGGLLGLEAANGLMKQGMEVTVVHLLGTLMERQLDQVAADLLMRSLQERGMQFRLQAQTTEVLGDDRVTGVRFQDGSELPADLVVMAVGIRPNIELAQQSGLYCERGILVNDTLQTFDPSIYAVGECVQHRGSVYGLVAPLFEQAKVCANHLAEYGIAKYGGSMTSTKLKVTGIDLFSAGDFNGDEHSEEMVLQDAARGVYKKLVIRDNRIKGAVMYGDTLDGAWYFQLMRDEADITDLREHLLFGQAHIGDAGHGDEASRIAALPDNAEICGCNGVCKGEIVQAITSKKLFTLEDVRAHTKASNSCGSCTGLVESLLANTLGGDYSQTPSKKSLCPCTEHTHDEVREAIRTRELKTLPAVFEAMEWSTPDGCHVCRPALNYYLLMNWPGEYEDDGRARFINERVHANIQKDGTYSVVPRIWGGVTTPAELRAIAEVAEKYQVPTVKITGGQRIDLLGVKKGDLPAMWGDLSRAGFVSGHAYGKALRTVKTCVGSEWCRFGTQDSTGLGIQLEKLTWGTWTPHKFKIGVSGCPRNCAEATIKDLGVVCVDSGYELHVGGNGGVKVRATDFLCKVGSEAEVLEYAAAFVQYYRETARYLERTAPWIERVGLSLVKQKVVEDEVGRKALAKRFAESQAYAQHDPWLERAEGADAGEYRPLNRISA